MRHVLLLVFTLLLTACSKGVPNDKREYVGYWRGDKMSLEIQVNGSVMFIDKRGDKPVTVHGNISEFIDNDFVVGMAPFGTRISVSKPPYPDGPNKKMIVNDVEVTQYQLPPEGNKTFSL